MSLLNFDLLPWLQLRDDWGGLPVYRFLYVLSSFLFWEMEFMLFSSYQYKLRTVNRAVGLTHAILVSFASVYLLIYVEPLFPYPTTYCEPIPYCEVLFSIVFGYFLWDSYKTITLYGGYDFIFHAVVCAIIYGVVVIFPYAHRLAIQTLTWEISTIFLHANSFLYTQVLDQEGQYSEQTLKICKGLLFFARMMVIITFFSIRICMTFVTATVELADYVLELNYINAEVSCIKPDRMPEFIFTLNILFHMLNLYWFYLIWGKMLSTYCSKKKKIGDETDLKSNDTTQKKKERKERARGARIGGPGEDHFDEYRNRQHQQYNRTQTD